MTVIELHHHVGNWHEQSGNVINTGGAVSDWHEENTASVITSQWPGWQHDQNLAAIYAPQIADAFTGGMAAAEAFLAQMMSGEVRVTPTYAAQEISRLLASSLRNVMQPLWTEGYALGAISASHAVDTMADAPASATSAAAMVTKVGPEGYVHGWIYEGAGNADISRINFILTDEDGRSADPKLAAEVKDRISKFAATYPEDARNIGTVSLAQMSDNSIASTTQFASGVVNIRLNSTYYTDAVKMRAMLTKMKAAGNHPSDQTSYVIDHELGHVLDAADFDGSSSSYKSSNPVFNDKARMKAEFGSYAARDQFEAFGEAFAAGQAGTLSPDIAAAIDQALKQIRPADGRKMPTQTCAGFVPAAMLGVTKLAGDPYPLSVTTPDWQGWQPGDLDAAAKVATGARLTQLLHQWGINVIQSVSQTKLDDLAQLVASALADGKSSGQLAQEITGLLNVPSRAGMIAQTEIARASSAATLDTYLEQGVSTKQWITAPDERTCFPAGTSVLTPNGDVSIDRLHVGDQVITPQGTQIITATSVREYTGGITAVEAGEQLIVATDNHPFMTDLGWRDAVRINVGDFLQTSQDERVQVTGVIHFMFAKPDNMPAEFGEVSVFPAVSAFAARQAVPKISIGFNNNALVRECKVYNPLRDANLRLESDSGVLQRQSDCSFQTGLTFRPEIAFKRAKSPMRGVCYSNADIFSAGIASAVCQQRWCAFFRAKLNFTVRVVPESFTASLTANVNGIGNTACSRADGIPVSPLLTNDKVSVANWAMLSNKYRSLASAVAGGAAEFFFAGTSAEHLSTFSARFKRVDNLAFTGAGSRAELRLTTAAARNIISRKSNPTVATSTRYNITGIHHCATAATRAESSLRLEGAWKLKDFATLVARIRKQDANPSREWRIISSAPLLVYNITVDVEHVFYANNFLVHNCKICRACEAEGAIPLSQAFLAGVDAAPAHPRCRCAVTPASVGDFDLSDMTVEPLPGFNLVPLGKGHKGEGSIICGHGHKHHGKLGAAGFLIRAPRPSGETAYLLQQRAPSSDSAGKWSVFGGALLPGETPLEGATREVNEEIGAVHITCNEVSVAKVGPHGYIHGWIKVEPAMTTISSWDKHKDELLALARHEKATEPAMGHSEDRVLRRMAELQGFDAKPNKGPLNSDRETWYRGFGDRMDTSNGPELAHQYTDGDYFGSQGQHGNGAYFTTSQHRASTYGHVMAVQLHHDAKIGDSDDLYDDYETLPSDWKEIVDADPGKMAVFRGIDAFKPPGGSSRIVVNRGALRVDNEAAKSKSAFVPSLVIGHSYVDDHGDWSYTTFIADTPETFWPSFDGETPEESANWGWFTPDEMQNIKLHPGFKATLPKLLAGIAAKTASRGIIYKVGPEGYIHGWVYVGPAAGGDVTHPEHGHGTSTIISPAGKWRTVTYDNGERRVYPARVDESSTPHLEMERPPGPGEPLRGTTARLATPGKYDVDTPIEYRLGEKVTGDKARRKAVREYAANGFTKINGELRLASGDLGKVQEKRSDVANQVNAIDDAMAASSLNHSIETWRGIQNAKKLLGDAWQKDASMVGASWIDDGFGSTSTQQHVASVFDEGFEQGSGLNGTVLRLNVPSGIHAISVGDDSDRNENEILLDRGLQYTVTADNGLDDTGNRQLDVAVSQP